MSTEKLRRVLYTIGSLAIIYLFCTWITSGAPTSSIGLRFWLDSIVQPFGYVPIFGAVVMVIMLVIAAWAIYYIWAKDEYEEVCDYRARGDVSRLKDDIKMLTVQLEDQRKDTDRSNRNLTDDVTRLSSRVASVLPPWDSVREELADHAGRILELTNNGEARDRQVSDLKVKDEMRRSRLEAAIDEFRMVRRLVDMVKEHQNDHCEDLDMLKDVALRVLAQITTIRDWVGITAHEEAEAEAYIDGIPGLRDLTEQFKEALAGGDIGSVIGYWVAMQEAVDAAEEAKAEAAAADTDENEDPDGEDHEDVVADADGAGEQPELDLDQYDIPPKEPELEFDKIDPMLAQALDEAAGGTGDADILLEATTAESAEPQPTPTPTPEPPL